MNDKSRRETCPDSAASEPGPTSIRVSMDTEMRRGLPIAEIHRRAARAHRARDASRRVVAFYLADMASRGQHRELGFHSITQYAEARLGFSPSTTRELIATSRALEKLVLLDGAFSRDQIKWSNVRLLARIATPQTEAEWLEWARGRSTREIAAAVRCCEKGQPPADSGRRPICDPPAFHLPAEVDGAWWQRHGHMFRSSDDGNELIFEPGVSLESDAGAARAAAPPPANARSEPEDLPGRETA